MFKSLVMLPRPAKQLVVLCVDVALAVLATWLAFSFRLDAPHTPIGAQWYVYGITAVLPLPFFIRLGLYRAIFRYSGSDAMLATAKAIGLYAVTLTVILVVWRWAGVPRSLGLLQPLLFVLLVAASRFIARVTLANLTQQALPSEGRLLIYGAGTAGVQAASAIAISGQYQLLGFLTDDPTMAGRSINGVKVESSERVAELVQLLGVTDIVLALTKPNRTRRNEIVQSLRKLPVHVRTLPNWSDLASGRVTVQDFRELDIEDLLGRDPIAPDRHLISSDIQQRTVLVTGAGGSIGSELCRQIIAQAPSKLVLLDHSEFALYSIQQELAEWTRAQASQTDVVAVLASVLNESRVAAVLETHHPQTVYHAAAYKHVPLVQSNPGEGVLNNVDGTRILAHAAVRSGVQRFVLISTDKAVRPTNVMGASKRVAELVLQALAADGPSGTCFTMVRFGNVLGSSGSVVPLFRKQLAEGGPLTVTHPDVTRYFMTIPEAAQLVLQAGAMASGGDVFLLDMGEPVRIMDLARHMIELSGLTVRDEAKPDGDIAIEITGMRPGEKLYEELLLGNDPQPTSHPRIMKAHEAYFGLNELQPLLDDLLLAARQNDGAGMQAGLSRLVQGYQAQF
ncbi:MAG: hypothetical protein RLZZ126_108 [Pseudomonadota bacterium]|jgi:FlaA1/EpsC-like NDP-sugar epimerase